MQESPRSSDRKVGVVGLGYVGLPLALAFTEAGLSVVGVDANPGRVDELNAGHSPIDDMDDARLRACLERGLRILPADPAALADLDSVVVCVPTPITEAKEPDLAPVRSAADLLRRADQVLRLGAGWA